MLKVFLSVGFLQLLTMVALLGRTKALALLLGPEQYGVMAIIDRLLTVLVQVASLSLPIATLRFLSPLWEARRGEYFALFRGMRNVLLLAICIAATGAATLAWWTPGVFGAELVPYRPVLLAAFLTLPALGLDPFLRGTIASRFRHNRSMLFALQQTLIFAAAAVVGVWWQGLVGLYLVYAAAGLVFLGLVLRRLGPESPEPTARRPSLRLPRRVWRFSFSFLPLALMMPFATLYAGYRILDLYGEKAAGWMQAAVGISLAVGAVLGAANKIFLTPRVHREGNFEQRLSLALSYQKALLLLVGLLVTPVLLFPSLTVRILYSSDFLPGSPYVTLFVLAEILALCAAIYQAVVLAMDHVALYVTQNAAAHALALLGAHLLIPEHGIAGAALAMLAANLGLLMLSFAFLSRRHGARWPRRTLLLLVYVLVSSSFAGALGTAFPGLAPRVLALKVATYLALAAGLVLCLSAGDRAEGRRVLGESRQRLLRWIDN